MSATRVVLEGPGKFDYGASDLRAEWKRWKRGFNSWLICSEQDAKKEVVKVNLLLTLMGSEGQDIFETFEFTEEQPKLAHVLKQFDSHFAGLSNVTMARFRFFSSVQGRKSVAEFVTSLKSLANDCEFGDLKDSLVKDMIVINCSSEKLRERLLKEPKLDLTKAVQIARIGEEAERNVETIDRGANGDNVSALVAGKHRAYGQGGGGSIGLRRTFHGECFECGVYGHMARECPDRKEQLFRRDDRPEQSEGIMKRDDCDTRKSRAGYAVSYALGAASNRRSRKKWYVDSGASQHMAWDRERFDWYEPYRKPRTVWLGDGKTVRVYGQGEVKINVRSGSGAALITLKQVQFVPKLQMNLSSVPSTTKLGHAVKFVGQTCVVSCGSLNLRCPVNGDGLYEVPILLQHGGDQGQFGTSAECSTPGGVIMKSEHRGRFSRRPMDNVYDDSSRHQAGHGMAEPRIQAGGPSGYQDSPDTRTQIGGQGYPGASTRNRAKTGGHGYPGARTRKFSYSGRLANNGK